MSGCYHMSPPESVTEEHCTKVNLLLKAPACSVTKMLWWWRGGRREATVSAKRVSLCRLHGSPTDQIIFYAPLASLKHTLAMEHASRAPSNILRSH